MAFHRTLDSLQIRPEMFVSMEVTQKEYRVGGQRSPPGIKVQIGYGGQLRP